MFWMEKQCFDELCAKIEASVGPSTFKIDQYMDEFNGDDQKYNIIAVYEESTGGLISGEVKLAL